MAKIYCDANPSTIAYLIENGGSGWQKLPVGYTSMEAEYLAIVYGLNEFYIRWNRELDSRKQDMTIESKGEFFDVSTPSDNTPRVKPDAILILSDNEVVVKQLSRQYHIGNDRLRKLAQRVWQMTKGIDVKFEWISRSSNLAGMMLK